MAFEKYSTEKLKKLNKIALYLGVFGLVAMCIALGMAIYHISHDIDSQLVYLIPTVFGPLCFIPIIFSVVIGGEIKKRQQ